MIKYEKFRKEQETIREYGGKDVYAFLIVHELDWDGNNFETKLRAIRKFSAQDIFRDIANSVAPATDALLGSGQEVTMTRQALVRMIEDRDYTEYVMGVYRSDILPLLQLDPSR